VLYIKFAPRVFTWSSFCTGTYKVTDEEIAAHLFFERPQQKAQESQDELIMLKGGSNAS